MTVLPSQPRSFVIATPDAIVGMDLVGIVTTAFAKCQTRVASCFADASPDIAMAGVGTSILVSGKLIAQHSIPVLNACAESGANIVVFGEMSSIHRDQLTATFLDLPFTTMMVLDAIAGGTAA